MVPWEVVWAEAVLLFSEYKRRTDESILKYEYIFKAAKKLGAKYFTFHGDRAIYGLSDKSCSFTNSTCETLNNLSQLAVKNGITLCLENVCWCKSGNTEYLKNVSREVRNIGFTLDLKQARRAKIDYYEYLSAMGDKIRNIHISDFDKNNDCLLPGEGEFDFKRFFDETKEFGYNEDFLIEVYSSNFKEEKQIINSKNFLENLLIWKITNVWRFLFFSWK